MDVAAFSFLNIYEFAFQIIDAERVKVGRWEVYSKGYGHLPRNCVRVFKFVSE